MILFSSPFGFFQLFGVESISFNSGISDVYAEISAIFVNIRGALSKTLQVTIISSFDNTLSWSSVFGTYAGIYCTCLFEKLSNLIFKIPFVSSYVYPPDFPLFCDNTPKSTLLLIYCTLVTFKPTGI